MKTVTFLIGADGTDWWEDVELTDEEYERLKVALSDGSFFSSCDEVSDIYNRILDIERDFETPSWLNIQCYEFDNLEEEE